MALFNKVPEDIQTIIVGSMIVTIGASPGGALCPMLDLSVVAATWATMLYKIGEAHKVTFTKTECAKIITACGASVTGYLAGSKCINWLLNLLPGLGTLGAMAGNAVLNGYYTYAIGMAFHKMLETEDINGKTVVEIAKLLLRYFVPIPSFADLKEVYSLIRGELS